MDENIFEILEVDPSQYWTEKDLIDALHAKSVAWRADERRIARQRLEKLPGYERIIRNVTERELQRQQAKINHYDPNATQQALPAVAPTPHPTADPQLPYSRTPTTPMPHAPASFEEFRQKLRRDLKQWSDQQFTTDECRYKYITVATQVGIAYHMTLEAANQAFDKDVQDLGMPLPLPQKSQYAPEPVHTMGQQIEHGGVGGVIRLTDPQAWLCGCDTENPPEKLRCSDCSTPHELNCPQCGIAVFADFAECGTGHSLHPHKRTAILALIRDSQKQVEAAMRELAAQRNADGQISVAKAILQDARTQAAESWPMPSFGPDFLHQAIEDVAQAIKAAEGGNQPPPDGEIVVPPVAEDGRLQFTIRWPAVTTLPPGIHLERIEFWRRRGPDAPSGQEMSEAVISYPYDPSSLGRLFTCIDPPVDEKAAGPRQSLVNGQLYTYRCVCVYRTSANAADSGSSFVMSKGLIFSATPEPDPAIRDLHEVQASRATTDQGVEVTFAWTPPPRGVPSIIVSLTELPRSFNLAQKTAEFTAYTVAGLSRFSLALELGKQYWVTVVTEYRSRIYRGNTLPLADLVESVSFKHVKAFALGEALHVTFPWPGGYTRVQVMHSFTPQFTGNAVQRVDIPAQVGAIITHLIPLPQVADEHYIRLTPINDAAGQARQGVARTIRLGPRRRIYYYFLPSSDTEFGLRLWLEEPMPIPAFEVYGQVGPMPLERDSRQILAQTPPYALDPKQARQWLGIPIHINQASRTQRLGPNTHGRLFCADPAVADEVDLMLVAMPDVRGPRYTRGSLYP